MQVIEYSALVPDFRRDDAKNSKRFFSHFNKVNKKKSRVGPLLINDHVIDDDKDIAENLKLFSVLYLQGKI